MGYDSSSVYYYLLAPDRTVRGCQHGGVTIMESPLEKLTRVLRLFGLEVLEI